jgi:predicted permease
MISDLRVSLRTLAKSPGFVAVAVLTLALGIGVNTAMFSIVHGIALRGLPFPEQHRVMVVYSNVIGGSVGERAGISRPEFEDLRAAQKSFVDLAAYQEGTMTVSGPGGEPLRIDGLRVTPSALAMVGAPIQLGRWFNAEEDRPGAAQAVVLGHALWRDRFKSDPAALGTQIRVNGEWSTVVGVAPPNYKFPQEAEAWVPLRGYELAAKRDYRSLFVIGRLKPGVDAAQAQAEIDSLLANLARQHADVMKGVVFRTQTMRDTFVDQETRLILGIMLGAVGLVLLIACANVANLQLARASARAKEMAVRAALGAARGQVVRLLLAESLLLAAAGAVLGLLIAWAGVAVFAAYVVKLQPPYWMVFELNAPAVLYAVALTGLATVFAGLYPALRASRPDLNTVLKDAARGSTGAALGRFTRALVIGEIAFSCLLLVLAGLMVRTIVKMQTTPLGFETAGVFTGRVALPEVEFKTVEEQRRFFGQFASRLRARPEVAAAGLADLSPINDDSIFVQIEGRAPTPEGQRAPRASLRAVTPGYFAAMGQAILQGRDVAESDSADAPLVAAVSARFAELHWPGESPVGKRFRRGQGKPTEQTAWITVVGLVPSSMQGRFDANARPQVYVPYTQADEVPRMTAFVKARGSDAAALAAVVRQELRALHEDLPLYFAETLEQMVADAQFNKRLIGSLFMVFGVVAFVLAGVGLYGVMSYAVAQRTQEIGVRVALGATPGRVLGLVFRQGGWQLGIGLALGLLLAVPVANMMAMIYYGVTPTDGGAFGGAVASLLAAGLLACLVPALRALRVNPVEALRNE